MMTSQNTTPTPFPLQNFQSVRQALLNQHEIALLDVREEDTFAQAHPLFAANLPLARLALDARHRIPRLDTLTVVYDDGEGLDQVAAQTMNIPTSISVPGAELVLRVGALAPDPRTRIIVNCPGRTRSIIGTQSLVNAGIPNPVAALRNGTIGWTLAGQTLEHGAARRATPVPEVQRLAAAQQARAVADRAGVKRAQLADVLRFRSETTRTSYCLDVRTPEEYAAGHLSGFASAPGGQLVQETDVTLPVRGARAVLADLDGVCANMTASWLAQMDWEVWVLDGLQATDCSETGQLPPPVPPSPHRYRRPYEGTDNPHEAMQGYLDWEYGLVAQLARD